MYRQSTLPRPSSRGLIDHLAEALVQVWERLGLPLNEKSLAAE